jgi:DNA-binding transcriptional LysR family regulator
LAAALRTRTDFAPARLLDQVRLHFAELDDWGCWFRAAGVAMPEVIAAGPGGPVFSESTAVIEAAEAGQGIAIGRPSLTADAIAAGRLVQLFPDIRADDGWGYYLVATEVGLRRPAVAAFRDWLMAEIAKMPR